MRRLQAFRVGQTIPEGAKYIRSERRGTGHTYEKVLPPRSLLSFLGITEMVGTFEETEVVDLYEVES